MTSIRRIELVRSKEEDIPKELISPFWVNERLFPPSVGPRAVYLDGQADYPDIDYPSVEEEKAKQKEIWRPVQKDGIMFSGPAVEGQFGASRLHDIKERVAEELGSSSSALFFERVYSEVLNIELNLVVISTGVAAWTGEAYQDFGCL